MVGKGTRAELDRPVGRGFGESQRGLGPPIHGADTSLQPASESAGERKLTLDHAAGDLLDAIEVACVVRIHRPRRPGYPCVGERLGQACQRRVSRRVPAQGAFGARQVVEIDRAHLLLDGPLVERPGVFVTTHPFENVAQVVDGGGQVGIAFDGEAVVVSRGIEPSAVGVEQRSGHVALARDEALAKAMRRLDVGLAGDRITSVAVPDP